MPWLAWETATTLRVATRSGDVWAIEAVPLAGAASAPDIAVAADGVVVASALMRRYLDGASPEELGDQVAAIRHALDGSA